MLSTCTYVYAFCRCQAVEAIMLIASLVAFVQLHPETVHRPLLHWALCGQAVPYVGLE